MSRAHHTAWPSPSGCCWRTVVTSPNFAFDGSRTSRLLPVRATSPRARTPDRNSRPEMTCRGPVTKISCSIPASRASSTAYWISGRSTIVTISLGMVLVAGSRRVPRPATGNTALRTRLAFILGCDRSGFVGHRLRVGAGGMRGRRAARWRRQVERVGCTRLRLLDQLVDPVGPRIGRRRQQIVGGRRRPRHQRLDRKRMARGRLQVGDPRRSRRARAGRASRARRASIHAALRLAVRMLRLAARAMRMLVISCAMLAFAACHNRRRKRRQSSRSRGREPVRSRASTEATRASPRPRVMFNDPDGGEISLADFKGTPVLVNLWATLVRAVRQGTADARQAGRAHRDDGQLGVIAVSQDYGPQASVEAFLAKHKIGDLGAYQDPKMSSVRRARRRQVMPTTILYRRRAARKCGATSATSTGPAPRRLSCWPKPARRDKRLSRRPSIAARPSAIRASPMKSCGASGSPRNRPPSRIATGGTSKVTSSALVAPGGIDQPEIEDIGEGACRPAPRRRSRPRPSAAERRESTAGRRSSRPAA